MFDKQRLGLEIKRLRKTKKLTQSQLAHEICNQSEISRIEAGDFFPSIDLLYFISIRLNVSLLYFFEILTYEQVEEINIIRNDVWSFSQSKNYMELYSYLTNLLPRIKGFHPEIDTFLLWKKYLAEYYLNKIDAQYCLTELFLLLRRNIMGLDNELHLNIKNSIANILAENKNYEKSISLYKEILSEDFKTKESEKLEIKVHYNYGKLLFLRKDYENSLKITNNGIDLAIKRRDMTFLGQFYYQKGSIMEELDFTFEETAKIYNNALFFFEILNLKVYTNILLKEKSIFIGER